MLFSVFEYGQHVFVISLFVYSWKSPSGSVLSDVSGRISVDGNSLRLTDLQPSDSGNYTCLVENIAAQKEQTIQIMVSGAIQQLQYVLHISQMYCT